ncbi:MAG: protease inhibitor I9 family protein, partial [Proteobacteria bacterium]|nr:protease inhibitor I9 family protein [Pseudomonadota bacterium]
MTIYRQLVFFGLLLSSFNLLAQEESSLQSAGNIRLSGTEDPATSKVFIVQLRSPSAAEHHASSQIKLRFNKNDAAVQAYAAKITLEQDRVFEKIGPDARKIYSYKYGLNGFAARMSIAQARKLKSFPEVLNVWEDEIRPLATRHSATFLGLFDQDSGLRSKHGLSGDGLVIAVIDSGIAPGHPALLDTRAADKPRLCRSSWAETSLLGRWLCRRFDHAPGTVAFEALEDWVGECEAGEEFTASDCNNKLIGARWFIDGADNSGPIDDGEFRSPRDADGHGTHTATTAAGNRVSASIFGTTIGDIEG